MRKMLIVGGANGIGLSIATEMAKMETCEKIYIVDKVKIDKKNEHIKIESFEYDLTNEDYTFFDRFTDIDSLMITAGFGKLSLFKNLDEQYIIDSFRVNTISIIRLIKRFYNKIDSSQDFYCGVMVSIAGFMSSPFFSVYGSTKAALKIFIESVNVELEKSGTSNRILNVSPGSIKGTSFDKGETMLDITRPLALEIICKLNQKCDLFIPEYDEIFKNVLNRYHEDFRTEGLHSYDYKLNSGRIR